ncbi:TPA: hypothetical protein IGZ64_004861, partial [Escherichia coli]|nr:hypothetical protein [Escherichia coli]
IVNNYGIIDINNPTQVISKPDGGNNTLELAYGNNMTNSVDIINFDGASGQQGTVKIGTIVGAYDPAVSSYLTNSVLYFNLIDKIIYTGSNVFRAIWGTAQSVNLTINNGNNNVSLFVNGGNNVIDLGYTGSSDKIAFVSYTDTKNAGIIYDAMNGGNIVSFSDGRGNDILKNFNTIQGSDGNDSVTLKSGLTFISSGGNDTLIGNGAVYELYKSHTETIADFANNTITKYQGSTLIGVDALSGVGFNQFTNSSTSRKATIYASNVNDMSFEFRAGVVDFYSSESTNNTTNSGNAILTTHYENFNSSITFANINGSRWQITKQGGQFNDTASSISVLNG